MKKLLTIGTLLLGCCLAAAQTATQAGNTQAITVQGCLSQSPDGAFMLADNAGDLFQLLGDTSQLNTFIGKQVRVQGMPMNNSAADPNAMAADTADASTGVAQQFTVSSAYKVADSCALSK